MKFCANISFTVRPIPRKYETKHRKDQKTAFCAGLRLEELALARACAAGSERAWQDFISRYRQKLHSMALHITRDGAHAAELADSLFADLYGVNLRDGVRNSKLVFYTGRGSLEGWLRTVMAQEFINRYRKQKNTVSLDEQTDEGAQFAARFPSRCSRGPTRLEAATDEALAELSSEDRFTLARRIFSMGGRSPRLRARSGCTNRALAGGWTGFQPGSGSGFWRGCGDKGISHAQAAEALETDVRDMGLNLRSRLTQDSGTKTFPDSKVPAQESSDGDVG